MSARDVIAQALVLSEAATDGPWRVWASASDSARDSAVETAWTYDSDGDTNLITDYMTAPDAAFTAAARTLLPALAKALGDVLDVADGHDQRADQAGRLDFDPTQSGMATAHRLAARGIRAAITAALSEVTP